MNNVPYFIKVLEKLTGKQVILENASLVKKAETLAKQIKNDLGLTKSEGNCGYVSIYLWDALGKPQNFKPAYGFMFGSPSKAAMPHVVLWNDKTGEFIDATGDQFQKIKHIPFYGIMDPEDFQDFEYISQRDMEAIKSEFEDERERNPNFMK